MGIERAECGKPLKGACAGDGYYFFRTKHVQFGLFRIVEQACAILRSAQSVQIVIRFPLDRVRLFFGSY